MRNTILRRPVVQVEASGFPKTRSSPVQSHSDRVLPSSTPNSEAANEDKGVSGRKAK